MQIWAHSMQRVSEIFQNERDCDNSAEKVQPHQPFSFCSFSCSSGVNFSPSAAFLAVASACRIFLRRFLSCFSVSCDAGGAAAPEFCSTSAALGPAVLASAAAAAAAAAPGVVLDELLAVLAVFAVSAVCCLLPLRPGGCP